jgi:phosphoglycolate phosphatase
MRLDICIIFILMKYCEQEERSDTSETSLDHVRGIVFDLDGTLIYSTIDFVEMRRRTFEILSCAGIPSGILDRTRSIAHNVTASVGFLKGLGKESEAQTLYAEIGRTMSEIEMRRVSETIAVPGAGRSISSLLEKGFSVAVLTRGSRRYTEAALEASGLAQSLPHRLCRDDHPDEEAKPNPISMMRASEKMRLRKEECLLVGDHPMDLECARSAGSAFIGVLSGASDRATWMKHGVVIMIPDVSSLPDLLTR